MPILEWSTPQETEAWVREQLAQLQRPCVMLLSGPLGAGKTQLVKWFLQGLGVQNVASPTFAIHHVYATASGSIDHLDLYRLQQDSELESIGLWDILAQPSGLVFVEWADRLPDDIWPKTWTQILVRIEPSPKGRSATFQIKPPVSAR